MNYRLLLASKSPRRQQLLRELGLSFEIRVKEVAEDFPPHLHREQIAEYLAAHKGAAYAKELAADELIITADTIVCVDDLVLNKPADAAEAKEMLQQLSGRAHQVITGVCVQTNEKQLVFHDVTDVHFKELTEAEIDYYIRTCKPFDKAGAYGIQEWIGMIGIRKIEGSYFNVVGLPVQKLYKALLAFGVQVA